MPTQFYIGPVTKHVVDSVIEFNLSTGTSIGLIPSRRQIDHDGGYVNNWNTKTFSEYVKSKSEYVILERDHGGPGQGDIPDDGKQSLIVDCNCFDIVHIDPWKACRNFEEGCQLTSELITLCHQQNPLLKFEIGTEESIFHYEAEDLESLVLHLQKTLPVEAYDNISIAVIQSGTSLKENQNTGVYNPTRLRKMVAICKAYGLISKEHNGDYLTNDIISSKFDNGLNAINIAPEFGQLETQVYIEETQRLKLFDIFFDICYKSGKWVKWIDKSFVPESNKEKLVNICGHYVLSDPRFLKEIAPHISASVTEKVKQTIRNRLNELISL